MQPVLIDRRQLVTQRGVKIFDNFRLALHFFLRSSAQGVTREAELDRPAGTMTGDLVGSREKIKVRLQATFAPSVSEAVSRRALSMSSRMDRTQRPHCGSQPKHLCTWHGVRGGLGASSAARTCLSLNTLQEQMIIRRSLPSIQEQKYRLAVRLKKAMKNIIYNDSKVLHFYPTNSYLRRSSSCCSYNNSKLSAVSGGCFFVGERGFKPSVFCQLKLLRQCCAFKSE